MKWIKIIFYFENKINELNDCFPTTDKQTPTPLHKWPSRHKQCAMYKKNDGRKISHHIISRLGATVVQKGRFKHPKIQL